MEVAASRIPVSLRPYFQEYTLEESETAVDAFIIIERTLARGMRDELRWLFSTYSEEQLIRWIQKVGWRRLPRRRLIFWAAFFELDNLPKRQGLWPHQQ